MDKRFFRSFHSPVSLDMIRKFEERNNLIFPDQYMKFLLEVNGSEVYFNENYHYEILNFKYDNITKFCSLDEINSIYENIGELKLRYKSLIIGIGTFGNGLFSIGIDSENLGMIFSFLTDEIDADGFIRDYFVADSLENFFKKFSFVEN